MDCPKCGGRLLCVDTRIVYNADKHGVVRRRVCEVCHATVKTEERITQHLAQSTHVSGFLTKP
jgi:transcriptional regulator NrdR family protein